MGNNSTFKRKIYDGMIQWKKRNGSTALLIEGARRVGKSTIVKEFGKREYKSFIFIDFTNPKSGTKTLFENGPGDDFDTFFGKLQISEKTKLFPRESLIIFDEVQAYPRARQLIKHFVADGRYDYIETGSLISLRKNIENITIPSEEEHIEMHPMDFEEFCWAKGDELSVPYIRDCFEKRIPVSDTMHGIFLERYREYMIIGGMPQVVSAFLEHKDYLEADFEKRAIFDLYEDDVEKIPSPDNVKVTSILNSLPLMLGKKNKKFSPGVIRKGSRISDFRRSLDWLDHAKILNICEGVTDPSPIMAIDIDDSKKKCYLFDTGLLVTKSIGDNKKEKNELYRALIFDRLSINEGMFFENMVAQELTASGHELFFHTFTVKDSTKGYEVDFLLKDGKYVIPIEVKSEKSRRHASLDRFMEKYSKRYKECFVIHDKDLYVDGKITYIPIYMTMFL